MAKSKEEEKNPRQLFREKLLKTKTPLKFSVAGNIERCISTGLASVDVISGRDHLGRYGIPVGSLVTVFGNPSDGKTTFTLDIARSAQEGGSGPPLQIVHQDMEGLLTREYMEQQGVKTNDVIYSAPETLEEAFDAAITLLKAAKEDGISLLMVLDSISATPTLAEMGLKSIGDSTSMGAHARITSKAFRMINGLLRSTGSIYVVVAQSRSTMKAYVPDTFIAFKPLVFHSGLVYKVSRMAWIKKGMDKIGMEVRVEVRKNKVGPPMKVAGPIDFYFGTGFDKYGSVIEALELLGLAKLDRRTYVYCGPNEELKGVKLKFGKRNLAKDRLEALIAEIDREGMARMEALVG